MDCSVCLSQFTDSIRKPVKCSYCENVACLICLKTYALQHANAPKCPSCNRGYTVDFIDTTFSKSFRRGQLRKERIKNLGELEKSLFPETMPIVEQRQHVRKKAELDEQLIQVLRYIRQYRWEDSFANTLKELTSELHSLNTKITTTEKKQKNVRTAKCPGCRGYIQISVTGTCEYCNYKMCRSCGQKKEDIHACNESEVLTWTLLKEQYRQCPKCATSIEKVSGCNQMFCIACNTAFDWTSGNILNGQIHNPHYFEFLRRNGDVHNENINCMDARFTVQDENRIVRNVPAKYTTLFQNIWQICRWIADIVHLHPQNVYGPNTYRNMRIQYLEGTIKTEEEFLKKLSLVETRRIKSQRLNEIDRMFVACSRDTFSVLSGSTLEDSHFQTFFQAMNILRDYTQSAKMSVLSEYSDMSFNHPGHDWRMTPIRVEHQ